MAKVPALMKCRHFFGGVKSTGLSELMRIIFDPRNLGAFGKVLDHEDLFGSRSRIFVASNIGSTPKDSIRIRIFRILDGGKALEYIFNGFHKCFCIAMLNISSTCYSTK